MFKRKNQLSLMTRIKGWIWPHIGWRRWGHYIRHRISRLPDTPERIAAGLAFGAAISFTPFIGFHVILSIAFAMLFRANSLAAVIGTIVGNPWTFPFIWVGIYKTGLFLLSRQENESFSDAMSGALFTNPMEMFDPFLLPMFIGSIPFAVGVWFLTFWLFRRIISRYQDDRNTRIKRKRNEKGSPR